MSILRKNPYKAFWAWFGRHSDEYFNAAGDIGAVAAAVNGQLQKIDSNLEAEFGPLRSPQREVFISCNGIYRSAHQVSRLVDEAPAMIQWQVVAFKQRTDMQQATYSGVILSLDDIYYDYQFNENGRVNIALYIKGYSKETHEACGTLGFIFLDHLLGEYDVMTKLGVIDFRPLPDRLPDGLSPLSKLAAFIDSRPSNPPEIALVEHR